MRLKSYRVNHRRAWVGEDLKDHQAPAPATGRVKNIGEIRFVMKETGRAQEYAVKQEG